MTDTGVIIVAGGSGSRMGADVPKQFLPLCGVPILALTLKRFIEALPKSKIIVVLPETETTRWEEICREEGLQGTHTVCGGGATRFESVKRGLNVLGKCNYIAVHDGVRPLTSKDMILRCMDTARLYGNAIPAVKPVDSFRQITADGSQAVDRDSLRAVQTPQVFLAETLRKAYAVEYRPEFTDDASVMESVGERIFLCEGERGNIKITTPEDIATAEAILRSV